MGLRTVPTGRLIARRLQITAFLLVSYIIAVYKAVDGSVDNKEEKKMYIFPFVRLWISLKNGRTVRTRRSLGALSTWPHPGGERGRCCGNRSVRLRWHAQPIIPFVKSKFISTLFCFFTPPLYLRFWVFICDEIIHIIFCSFGNVSGRVRFFNHYIC